MYLSNYYILNLYVNIIVSDPNMYSLANHTSIITVPTLEHIHFRIKIPFPEYFNVKMNTDIIKYMKSVYKECTGKDPET